jgi:hypothetical protein
MPKDLHGWARRPPAWQLRESSPATGSHGEGASGPPGPVHPPASLRVPARGTPSRLATQWQPLAGSNSDSILPSKHPSARNLKVGCRACHARPSQPWPGARLGGAHGGVSKALANSEALTGGALQVHERARAESLAAGTSLSGSGSPRRRLQSRHGGLDWPLAATGPSFRGPWPVSGRP